MGISVWGRRGSCTRSLGGWPGWSVGVLHRAPAGGPHQVPKWRLGVLRWVPARRWSLPVSPCGVPVGVPVCSMEVLHRGRSLPGPGGGPGPDSGVPARMPVCSVGVLSRAPGGAPSLPGSPRGVPAGVPPRVAAAALTPSPHPAGPPGGL